METLGASVRVDVHVSVDGEIGFVRLEWHDRMSEPFTGVLDIVVRDSSLRMDKLLGTTAGVTIRGASRRVQRLWGDVDRVEFRGTRHGWSEYRLRLRPELARLSRRRRSKVYSDLAVHEIVAEVLADNGLEPALVRVDRPFETRDIVVQHDQTDLDFITGLLGEEPIYYAFEHSASGHRFVVADKPVDRRRKLPMILSAADGDGVTSWAAAVEVGDTGPESIATGLATAVGVDVGEVVHLEGHDRNDQNTAHAVLGVELVVVVDDQQAPQRAGAPAELVTELVAVPVADVPGHPLVPRASTGRAYTATVVGPPGEDLYVDQLGRVQLEIHWPDADEQTADWVPVAQPWAGAGHGTTYWPRVGDRVWVEFEGGDVSRPVVTASLYTDDNPPPDPLPDAKRRTVVTSAAGEFVLDDTGGDEQMLITAQRDLSISAADSVVISTDDGTVEALGDLEISAAGSLVLRCGDASISLSGNGNIQITGDIISVNGQDKIALTSPTVTGT